MTLDFFHMEGKISVPIQILKSINKSFNNAESQIFVFLIELSSCPCALLTVKALIIVMIQLKAASHW